MTIVSKCPVNIEEQEAMIPRKYRTGGVPVKTVKDLKKVLAELPDWLPIDCGLSHNSPMAIVTRNIRRDGDQLLFLLEESE